MKITTDDITQLPDDPCDSAVAWLIVIDRDALVRYLESLCCDPPE